MSRESFSISASAGCARDWTLHVRSFSVVFGFSPLLDQTEQNSVVVSFLHNLRQSKWLTYWLTYREVDREKKCSFFFAWIVKTVYVSQVVNSVTSVDCVYSLFLWLFLRGLLCFVFLIFKEICTEHTHTLSRHIARHILFFYGVPSAA